MDTRTRLAPLALITVGAVGAYASSGAPEAVAAEPEPEAAAPVEHAPPVSTRRIAIVPPSSIEPAPMAAAHARPADVVPAELGPAPTDVVIDPDLAAKDDLGRRTFVREWTSDEGLGAPEFNAASCAECHRDPVVGGAGPLDKNVHAIDPGVTDSISRYQRFHREIAKDGQLDARTRARLRSRIAKMIEREQRRATKRGAPVSLGMQTPSLLGLGLVDRIPDEEILSRVDPDDRDMDGIRGVAGSATIEFDGGRSVVEVGRFGWTASVPRLADFVAMALGGENGITIPDQGRGFGLVEDIDDAADPELDQSGLDAVIEFVTNLPAPERKGGAHRAEVELGRRVFRTVGCADCHVPVLHTSDGTPVPLYSDLLLHRATKSPDGVKVKEVARFRTPPLWGIADTAPYMHDGSAEDLRAAILAHDHEAKRARETFEGLLEYDADALIAFLEDL